MTDEPGRLDEANLTVVSNREPYVHEYDGDGVRVERPTGGLVAALDGVVADVGGTWVAWGSGEADFDPDVAPDGELSLPPGADEAVAGARSAATTDDRAGYRLSRVDLPPRLVEDREEDVDNWLAEQVARLSGE